MGFRLFRGMCIASGVRPLSGVTLLRNQTSGVAVGCGFVRGCLQALWRTWQPSIASPPSHPRDLPCSAFKEEWPCQSTATVTSRPPGRWCPGAGPSIRPRRSCWS